MARRKFPEYTYKGYTYKPWEEVEHDSDGVPENVKIWHTVEHTDGVQYEIDWSPYNVPTEEDFKLWVDLGRPDRDDEAFGKRTCFFPIDREDLLKIQQFRFGTAEALGE